MEQCERLIAALGIGWVTATLRKYGKVIVEDREIFDQCTDTIVRQVDDIKRMVDEFSSFARTPKPRLEDEDVNVTVKQVLFLMNPNLFVA